MTKSEKLKVFRPAWRAYWQYWLFSWLLLPLLVMIWKRMSVRLLIAENAVTYEEGIFTTRSVEIPLKSIRTVEVSQTVFQKLLCVGDVFVGASATAGFEIVARGFADPRRIRSRIETSL